MIVHCEKCSGRFRSDNAQAVGDGSFVVCPACGGKVAVLEEVSDFEELKTASSPPARPSGTGEWSSPSAEAEPERREPPQEPVTQLVEMAAGQVKGLMTTGEDPMRTAGPGGNLSPELFANTGSTAPAPANPQADPFAASLMQDSSEVPRVVARQRVGASLLPQRSRSANALNYLFAGCELAVLVFGVMYFAAGDQLRAELGADATISRELPSLDGIHITSVRSVDYPTALGSQLLVVLGTAHNSDNSSHEGVYVTAELVDHQGEVVSSHKAPLGLALGPAELSGLTSRESLSAAYVARARARGDLSIPAGEDVDYTVVFVEPPRQAAELHHVLSLQKGEPIAIDIPEPETVVEGEALRKGKRKGRKGRRKGRKGKRKGKRKKRAEHVE